MFGRSLLHQQSRTRQVPSTTLSIAHGLLGNASAAARSDKALTAVVLRIWRTGIDESRAGEYRGVARRNSVPMFSAQPGFVGGAFAVAPRQRAVEALWE